MMMTGHDAGPLERMSVNGQAPQIIIEKKVIFSRDKQYFYNHFSPLNSTHCTDTFPHKINGNKYTI
ncbi:amino acid adenylation domain protein [Edwardsiella piscicida]|nr:amino acid adenylation domain protein [Edwardsiella piscicida]